MSDIKSYNKAWFFRLVIFVLIGITLIIFLPGRFQNKMDVSWLRLDTILYANGIVNPKIPVSISETDKIKFRIPDVSDSLDKLKSIYYSLQKNSPDIEPFDSIIAKPFPLLDDYNKFTGFLHQLLTKKKLVVEGISGSGKSTIIDRVSRLITGKPENILKLECVEKLEVEYHKEYVGYRNGTAFMPGKLLAFLRDAEQNPLENFIFVIDDVDKIYPSTLLGSVIWKELDNSIYDSHIDGYPFEIKIPGNLYIMSVTHSDVGNIIEFNAEHFRRLGDIYKLNSNYKVFLLYMKSKIKGKVEYSHFKNLIYTFIKANEFIESKYGTGYTLGQWSNLRKKIQLEDYQEFRQLFVDNVNAFKPETEMHLSNLDDIQYVIDNDGLIPRSSDFAVIFGLAKETGLFSEITVGVLFALLSGFVGYLLLRKRRKFMEQQNYILIKIQSDFEERIIDFEQAISSIIGHKENLKKHVREGRIKYEEYIYFSIFIEDIIKKLEKTQGAMEITDSFDSTFREFMVDGKLDESEYKILVKFLNNMKSALPPDIYYTLKNKIDTLFQGPKSY